MAAAYPSTARRVQRLLRQVGGSSGAGQHTQVGAVGRSDTGTRGGASGSRRGRGRGRSGAGAAQDDGAESTAPPVATLPLHPLHVTCQRLLATAAPLLRDDGGVEADELETAVRLFLASEDAEKLQQHVAAARDKHPLQNFMLEWWNKSYLAGRYANPINVNPFLGFASHVCQPNQVLMAAAITHHTAKFVHTLQTKTRPPDMDISGRVPLCNSQYEHMFGTMRLPRPGMDELVHHPMSRHIIVVRHQRFYRLEILDAERKPYTKETLAAHLTSIVTEDRSIPKNPEQCVGVLTSLDRDTWAALHEELRTHAPANRLFLDTLASALFFVNLDAASPSEATPLADQFLFGGRASWPTEQSPRWPSNVDGLARWYDKSIQLIVLANGRVAFNFEHSWGDGSSLTRAFHEIAHDMMGTASGFPETLSHVPVSTLDAPVPECLTVSLPPSWSAAANGSAKVPGTPVGMSVLKAAAVSMGQRVANVWVEADWWTEFGSSYIKRNWHISPDAVSQLCMQVAVRESMRHILPDDVGISTYEAMDMRHCAGGRTETIRVVTPESTKFVRMMLSEATVDPVALREALHRAADAHRARAQDMRAGNGIERHLFALMCAARELGVKPPPLFKAAGLRRMLTNTLSTSTLASDVINVGGFGPVEAVGFGGGYFLQPDHFYMAIATNRFRLATEADVTAGTAPAVGAPVSTRCSATDFMDAWRRTIRRIDDLCRSTPPPESALRHRKPKA